ncbi:carbohydrate kinase [Rhodotorula sp. JG-1b]|nr:carbohydrate kinase [Rhodotorula sp. JG-1b]
MSAQPALIICMGTSGCGKSTVGLALAKALGVPFIDGDDLHPADNVAKMSAGHPLTDEDRIPWLHRVRETAVLLTSPAGLAAVDHPAREAVVVACSALTVQYRNLLRGEEARFQFRPSLTVQGSRALLLNRMQHRAGHFMKASMLDSQLSTLQEPHETDEVNVSVVKLGSGPDEATERGKEAVIQEAVEKISRKVGP